MVYEHDNGHDKNIFNWIPSYTLYTDPGDDKIPEHCLFPVQNLNKNCPMDSIQVTIIV